MLFHLFHIIFMFIIYNFFLRDTEQLKKSQEHIREEEMTTQSYGVTTNLYHIFV